MAGTLVMGLRWAGPIEVDTAMFFIYFKCQASKMDRS